MTDAERFKLARKNGEIVIHASDFYCRRCGGNYDLVAMQGKFSPAAFVLAHMKSCTLRASTS